MRRRAAFLVAVVIAAGCSGDDETREAGEFPRGGTLRLASGDLLIGPEYNPFPLDPQRFSFVALELHRCCLLRTLVSYTGRPTRAGGALLRQDLAASPPRVSADGRRWTFRLKPGVRYAPPFEDTEIVAGDVIRALERTLRPSTKSDYASYFQVIEGAQAFAAGRADSISGLESPDERTLVVHLTKPTSHLGAHFALPAAAPIPPGAAERHADYGRFLVASGPYMVEGAERLDFTMPPKRQEPASGYRPGRSLTLVRNPSWDPATDPLRPAYVDRIEIGIGDKSHLRLPEVEKGRLDFVADSPSPPAYVNRYRRSAELRRRVHRGPFDITWATWMKLATPPFDDIHVRKAVNLAIDKQRLRMLISAEPYYGAWLTGEVTGHLVPDALQNNLLLDYHPYRTAGHAGDLDAARAEMARSRYDRNHDGRCDHRACRAIPGAVNNVAPLPRMARAIAHDLGQIGIRVLVKPLPATVLFGETLGPRSKMPLVLAIGWNKDFGGAASFFDATFSRSGIGEQGVNFSLVGATPEELRRWDYAQTRVPSIDTKIDECSGRVGAAAFECWAEADQVLMERIVPWAPFLSGRQLRVVSDRIAHFSFAQSTTLPALDQIALKAGSS